jgi:hypothetical protein
MTRFLLRRTWSGSGPSRRSRRYNSLVVIGGIGDIGMRRSPEGSVAVDPDRHFAPVNYRSAKALLDHFIGNGEQCRRYGKAERLGGL